MVFFSMSRVCFVDSYVCARARVANETASGNSRTQPKLVCSSTFPFICPAPSIVTLPFSSFPLVMSKKAAKNNEPETNYAERDIVLGKVRGFPPWPGMVCRVFLVPRKPSFILFIPIGRESRQCPIRRCQGAPYWQKDALSLCQVFPYRRVVRLHLHLPLSRW